METLAIGIRNAGTLAPPSFSQLFPLTWTTLSASVDLVGKEMGLEIWGFGSGSWGLSYGSLCEDCVCLSLFLVGGGGMTPKYNTRRAFVFLTTPSLLPGSEGRQEDWGTIRFRLLWWGRCPYYYIYIFIFFPLKVSALREDTDNE